MAIEKRIYADSEQAKAAMDALLAKGFDDVKASFRPGKVQVAVNARFGEGAAAAQILDSFGPSAVHDEEFAEEAAKAPAVARPFEFANFKDSATPLSDFFGWSVLKEYRSPFWPEALIDDPTPLSNKFGWSVLYGASIP